MISVVSVLPAASAYDEQGLAVFDRLTVFDQNRTDHAVEVGFDFIEQFHRFDNAHRLAGLDGLSDFDE